MAIVQISAGSNMGDRLSYIQSGVNAISESIGLVTSISNVVETPSFDFDGNPFLNACFLVETTLSPDRVMHHLLRIEKNLGRTRSENKGYENRTLDLDILFYDNLVINTDSLIIPHPSLEKRRFVLQPLSEIAPNKVHPVTSKSIELLLEECQDNNQISMFEIKLTNPIFNKLKKHTFICVEGIIGCGKTTLSNIIAKNLGYKTIEERFQENPFLPKFYRKPNRYAFPLELSFLADRFNQINEEAEQLDLFKFGVVADYHISKSLVFAQNTLNADEYPLFHQLYKLMSKSANHPSLCVFLKQTPKQAKKNIIKRGRSYEQNISLEYLKKLAVGYDKHIPFLEQKMQVINIDVSSLDFVLNKADFDKLMQKVNAQLDAVL